MNRRDFTVSLLGMLAAATAGTAYAGRGLLRNRIREKKPLPPMERSGIWRFCFMRA